MQKVNRLLLIAAGSVSLGLGLVGVLLPLLPATPFFLLAAFCFARSSERLHSMILNSRWTGPYIRNYRDGRPMTFTQLSTTLLALWLSIASTAALVGSLKVALILLVVAAGVTTFLVGRNRRLRVKAGNEPASRIQTVAPR